MRDCIWECHKGMRCLEDVTSDLSSIGRNEIDNHGGGVAVVVMHLTPPSATITSACSTTSIVLSCDARRDFKEHSKLAQCCISRRKNASRVCDVL
mmetsp:Transcript_54773/g.66028  ORF Transcript_54773/g.66028 Transcript_54773/m.66028 type:complete len:95 (+) Transcript_54773:2691-2975(+)